MVNNGLERKINNLKLELQSIEEEFEKNVENIKHSYDNVWGADVIIVDTKDSDIIHRAKLESWSVDIPILTTHNKLRNLDDILAIGSAKVKSLEEEKIKQYQEENKDSFPVIVQLCPWSFLRSDGEIAVYCDNHITLVKYAIVLDEHLWR